MQVVVGTWHQSAAPSSASADLLASCPGLGSHRWLRVEAVLTTTVTGVRPVVRNINASWAY